MKAQETIAAISSAVGAAARIIVRVSGARSRELLQGLGGPADLRGGEARWGEVRVGDMSVPAWVYVFYGPRSYTGEDLVELHLPGSPLLARIVLDELIQRGARPAEAGEFTARAYFNGRIGLAEAEGIAAAISAHGERELRAARQLMGGELARRLRPLMDELAQTLALVEAGIDFSDEDVTFIAAAEVGQRASEVDARLAELVAGSARFERLAHEVEFVLVGRPNAGKSTLLNALAGQERAVVSHVPGTTRDALSAEVTLERGIVRVTDVAGLDEGACEGAIDRKMREHALAMVEKADFVVLVREAVDSRPAIPLPRRPDLVVASKVDLGGAAAGDVQVSARTGQNLPELRRRMGLLAFGEGGSAEGLALNGRHLREIARAREALGRVGEAVQRGAEVAALELREALDALGEVLGQMTPDDVLGRVFATFCIGK